MFVEVVLTLFVFSLCDYCVLSLDSEETYPKVFTPAGEFQGSVLESRLGKKINAFRGIRYAEAPIGSLRFKVC